MNVNARMLKGLEELFQENTISTIKLMAKKYGLNEEEALSFLNVREAVKMVKGKVKEVKEPKEKKEKEKKEKKEVPKMVLPFCGRVVSEWCEGVKMNHGLYSQCVSEKSVSETGEEKYCKSCKKQAATNESGKPTLGDINERMLKSSAEYRAEKGKKCVVYSVVMKKLKITKEEAVVEAKKFGLEIPEEEFEMPKSQRGRPKKLSESESVKSGSDEGEKKRRGRPKKNKTVAENHTDETDDLIASLVAEANALKSGSASESDEEESGSETDAEEEEEEPEKKNVLKAIVEKIKADETFNTLYSQVVPKAERKAHLAGIDEHLKTLLTEEEMALYTGAPEEEEEEEEEEVEDEASRKAREAAEKKAQVEAEKKAKKEQADLEKKQQAKEKKEQADLEKKAKAELEKKAKAEAEAEKKAQLEAEKKAKAEADAEKKAQLEAEKKAKAEAEKKAKAEADAEKKLQLEAEKKAKKEQADLEKKQQAKEKKEQADLEKKAQAKQKAEADKKAKEEAAALKKGGEKKPAEVTPVEKKATAELQAETVEEASVAEASVAEPTQTVNAKVFEFQGKKYLKTVYGILYDKETEDCVGVWNEETKSIDDFADDEE